MAPHYAAKCKDRWNTTWPGRVAVTTIGGAVQLWDVKRASEIAISKWVCIVHKLKRVSSLKRVRVSPYEACASYGFKGRTEKEFASGSARIERLHLLIPTIAMKLEPGLCMSDRCFSEEHDHSIKRVCMYRLALGPKCIPQGGQLMSDIFKYFAL